MGIISLKTNREDIADFSEQYKAINETFGEMVELIVFGYDIGSDEGYDCMKDINYTYVKPVSIAHYFKQLKSLELDVLLIPLINNLYNVTSENYNKYLEAGVFGVPILTIDMYPYNRLVLDKRNGFLVKEKGQIIEYIELFMQEAEGVANVGKNARIDVLNNFNYNQANIEVLSEMFEYGVQEEFLDE